MKWPMELPTGSIDALTYCGAWPLWPTPESGEGAILRHMDRLGIEHSMVLSLQTVFGDATAGNAELAGVMRQHADRLSGVITFDPRRPVAPADVMQRGRDAGMRGLALFPAHHGYSLGDEPLVDEALWLADDYKWPVVIPIRLVMCWWIASTPVRPIIELARRHPRIQILVASGSYNENDAVTRAMSECNNLYADISGAQGLDFLTDSIEYGDASRLLFGSGQPIQMPECNLVKLAGDRLDARTRKAILRDNAARLFHL
jgi:predicted TIM-barrel fold metal-dependent hydrolase